MTMTDSELERAIDVAVQRRLERDPRYVNAENAEEQADAERAIELEAAIDIYSRHEPHRFRFVLEELRDELREGVS